MFSLPNAMAKIAMSFVKPIGNLLHADSLSYLMEMSFMAAQTWKIQMANFGVQSRPMRQIIIKGSNNNGVIALKTLVPSKTLLGNKKTLQPRHSTT